MEVFLFTLLSMWILHPAIMVYECLHLLYVQFFIFSFPEALCILIGKYVFVVLDYSYLLSIPIVGIRDIIIGAIEVKVVKQQAIHFFIVLIFHHCLLNIL